MICLDAQHLLMIEPKGAPTAPIVDYITKLAAGVWSAAVASQYGYRGVHGCTGRGCSAVSDNKDHTLPNGAITNSLIVHYVACHRDEVPEDQLLAIATMGRTAEPTTGHLTGVREVAP